MPIWCLIPVQFCTSRWSESIGTRYASSRSGPLSLYMWCRSDLRRLSGESPIAASFMISSRQLMIPIYQPCHKYLNQAIHPSMIICSTPGTQPLVQPSIRSFRHCKSVLQVRSMAANLEEHHLPNRLDGQKHESSEMSKDIDTELGVERKKDAVSIPGTSEPVKSFWQKLVNLGVELRGLEPIPLELRVTSIFSHYPQKRPWGFFRKYYLNPQNMQYLADMTALGLQDWHRGRHDAWVRAVASAGSSNDYLPAADSSHTVLLHPHPRTAPRYETVVSVSLRLWVSRALTVFLLLPCMLTDPRRKYFNQVISSVGLLGTAIFGIVASVRGGQTLHRRRHRHYSSHRLLHRFYGLQSPTRVCTICLDPRGIWHRHSHRLRWRPASSASTVVCNGRKTLA